MKILLLDDNVNFLETMKTYIELETDINCHTATTCKQALSMLLKEKYDLIILDYSLENEDCQAVVKFLGTINKPPTILVTAVHNPVEIHKHLDTDWWFPKPFKEGDIEYMFNIIKTIANAKKKLDLV